MGEYLLGSGTGQACRSDQPCEMSAASYMNSQSLGMLIDHAGMMGGVGGGLHHRVLCRLNEGPSVEHRAQGSWRRAGSQNKASHTSAVEGGDPLGSYLQHTTVQKT